MEEKEFILQLLNPKTQNNAFQKLLFDYKRPLYNHIRNIVLDHDDANDVLQNTFIKVYQNLNKFKGDNPPPFTNNDPVTLTDPVN